MHVRFIDRGAMHRPWCDALTVVRASCAGTRLGRICDPLSNIWRPPNAEHEAAAVVASAVERELKPLTELESFRQVRFYWYAHGTRHEEGDDDDDVGDSASVCTAVSKRGRGGGGGGKRGRSMISSVLHSFSQRVKNVVSEPPPSTSAAASLALSPPVNACTRVNTGALRGPRQSARSNRPQHPCVVGHSSWLPHPSCTTKPANELSAIQPLLLLRLLS